MTDMPDLDDFSVVSEGPVPVAKKDFDWKKSNGVKIGVAVGLVLLTVLIFGWQFNLFGGGKSAATAKSTGGTNPAPSTGQTPPPPPPAPVTPPSAPEDTTAGTSPTPTPTPPAQSGGPLGAPGASRMPPGYSGPMPPGMNPNAADRLTDDFTTWKAPDDFLRARKENHPKLLEAVFYASQKNGHTDDSAKLFIEILKPLKAEPNPNDTTGGYVQPPMPASAQLIETIVNALAYNGTQSAKDKLKEILSGDFSTDDDRAAIDAVIKSMAYHPGKENDALLLQLLTQPESVRKAAPVNPMNPQAAVTPSDLRTKAQEVIKLSASDTLRLKLAEYFAKNGIEPNDPTMQILLQEEPANLSAQLVLHQADEIGSETKTKLEQYFLDYASLALGLTMCVPSGVEGMALGNAPGMPPGGPGMPPGYGPGMVPGGPGMPPGYRGMPPGYGPGMPPGYRPGIPPSNPAGTPPGSGERGFSGGDSPTSDAAQKISDIDRGVKLANALWSSPMAASLAEQLGEVRSLEKSTPAIVLASTFPLDSMRAAMYRMLKKKQADGPQTLDAAGWGDRVLNDPGTLILVKMLNRREPKTPKGTSPSGPGGPGYGPGPSGTSPKAEAARKKAETENAWYNESLKLVGLWCNRFEAAAQAQRKAARKGSPIGEPAPTKLDDFELPKEKDTKIEEAYQLNWPEKAPAGFTPAKPGLLKIQYFHLTLTGTIKKTMANLTRGLKNTDPHKTDLGLWTEIAPKTTGASAPRRSLDVLVTKADKSPYDEKQREDPTDLEIRILAIEIGDPGTKE